MGLQNWSTTPANNANAAPNINMATGSAPSTVHPGVRQMMADVAAWYADPEWVLQADTPTYTSATNFTVPTNRTVTYSVGRRIQMAGPGSGTPYTINGTIIASAYGTVTAVTVQWDSGSLDNTVNSVAVGILQNQLSKLLSDLADTTAPTDGDALIGVKKTTAATATTQHAVNESRLLDAKIDMGAVGDMVADDLAAINAAMAASAKEFWLPSADYKVSAKPTNTNGVEKTGPGRILLPITGGNQQLDSYADKYQHITGREYLGAFHKRTAQQLGSNIVMTGDSTTAGTATTLPFQPDVLMTSIARARGIYNQVFWNRGQPGKTAVDWDSTYVATDITNGGLGSPQLMIVRWGVNDPDFAGTLATFTTAMRSALGKVRAALTVAQCSILIMSPNATSDTPNNRDERWNELIAPALRQIAREFQCAFFDTYAWCKDARGAANIWMDDPYTDGRSIHPLDPMNAVLYGGVADVIYPQGLVPALTNVFQNIANADVSTLSAGAIGNTYTQGISMYRATAANGWPQDGIVITFKSVDGPSLLQYNYAIAGTGVVYVRVGSGAAWGAWSQIGKTSDALTLTGGWVNYNSGSYNILAQVSGGAVNLSGLIKSGTMTSATVIANLPAKYRPAQTRWFSCPTDTAGQSAVLTISPPGDLAIFSCPSNGFLSLDSINFIP